MADTPTAETIVEAAPEAAPEDSNFTVVVTDAPAVVDLPPTPIEEYISDKTRAEMDLGKAMLNQHYANVRAESVPTQSKE